MYVIKFGGTSLAGQGGFHYDDEHSVVANPHIRSLSQVPRSLCEL